MSERLDMILGRLNRYFLAAICAASILLVLPTINDNIDDPNRIVYSSGDEGYQMDIVWHYYSGQKRASYQMSLDYGLEMVYLADMARLIFSKFINFTPGMFVLILRWIHLLAWVGALIALWHLVGYHFGRGWQQGAVVILLWSRPAFDYFVHGLKPDPVALFFVIIGLNYALKIVEKPSMRYLLISTGCAAMATVIKFAGVFLLPAIVVALYFGHKIKLPSDKHPEIYIRFKYPWLFPALVSIPLIAAPLLTMFFYVRKATGLTYYQEFGFWESLLKYKIVFLFWFAAVFLILISFLLFFLSNSKNYIVRRIMEKVSMFNSLSIFVAGLFLCFMILFGFRWLTMPAHFLETYAINVLDFSGGEVMRSIHSISDFFNLFLITIIGKLFSFDIFILLSFVLYLFTEIYYYAHNLKFDRLRFYKRMTLAIFFAPFFLSLFIIGRLVQLHMLPFFIAASILVIQGISMFQKEFKKSFLKFIVTILIGFILTVDTLVNGAQMVKGRLYAARKHENIIFEIEKWLKNNVPFDTRIVADHYNTVYIPLGYENVKTLSWNERDRPLGLRQLVDMHHPELIYYNTGPGESDENPMPPIEEVLPDKKLRLVKSFEAKGGRHHKAPIRYLIYEVEY